MKVICKKCGTEDFYFEEKRGPHLTAICGGCGSYIKHLGQDKPFVIPFGKYKGRVLSSMISKEETQYLWWLVEQDFCKKNMEDKIRKHLNVQ